MCVGKAMTGGYMTMAATLCTRRGRRRHLARARSPVLAHGPTFMAQPARRRGRRRLDRPAARRATGAATSPAIEAGLRDGLAPARELAGRARRAGARRRSAWCSSTTRSTWRRRPRRRSTRGVWLRPFRDLVYTMPPVRDDRRRSGADRGGRRGRRDRWLSYRPCSDFTLSPKVQLFEPSQLIDQVIRPLRPAEVFHACAPATATCSRRPRRTARAGPGPACRTAPGSWCPGSIRPVFRQLRLHREALHGAGRVGVAGAAVHAAVVVLHVQPPEAAVVGVLLDDRQVRAPDRAVGDAAAGDVRGLGRHGQAEVRRHLGQHPVDDPDQVGLRRRQRADVAAAGQAGLDVDVDAVEVVRLQDRHDRRDEPVGDGGWSSGRCRPRRRRSTSGSSRRPPWPGTSRPGVATLTPASMPFSHSTVPSERMTGNAALITL